MFLKVRDDFPLPIFAGLMIIYGMKYFNMGKKVSLIAVAIFMIVILAFPMAVSASSAESPKLDVKLTVSADTAKVGSTFDVTVSLGNYSSKNIPDIGGLQIDIPIDAKYLGYVDNSGKTLLKTESGDFVSAAYNQKTNQFTLMYAYMNTSAKPLNRSNTDAVSLKLKLLESIPDGKTLDLSCKVVAADTSSPTNPIAVSVTGAQIGPPGSSTGAGTSSGNGSSSGTGTASGSGTGSTTGTGTTPGTDTSSGTGTETATGTGSTTDSGTQPATDGSAASSDTVGTPPPSPSGTDTGAASSNPSNSQAQASNTDASSAQPSQNGDAAAAPAAPKVAKVVVQISSTDTLRWNKVTIRGKNVDSKNITTEQISDGLIIRADSLGNVSITVDKGNQTATVNVNTDRSAVLLQENADGNVVVLMDFNGDGTFETPLSAPVAFTEKDNGSFLIIAAVVVLAIIVVVILFLLKMRRQKRQAETPETPETLETVEKTDE